MAGTAAVAAVAAAGAAGVAVGADGADAEMSWRYGLVAAAWIAWEVYWGISARGVKRVASQEPLPSRLLVLAALILVFVLLFVPGWFNATLTRPFLPRGPDLFYLGFGGQLCGMGFAAWARRTLGRNWSGRVTIKKEHELVTAGPYRIVRHPIYTGALIAIFGSACALNRFGGLLAGLLILGVFLYKIRLEERMLDAHFGERYLEYRRHTRALLPFIL